MVEARLEVEVVDVLSPGRNKQQRDGSGGTCHHPIPACLPVHPLPQDLAQLEERLCEVSGPCVRT